MNSVVAGVDVESRFLLTSHVWTFICLSTYLPFDVLSCYRPLLTVTQTLGCGEGGGGCYCICNYAAIYPTSVNNAVLFKIIRRIIVLRNKYGMLPSGKGGSFRLPEKNV